MANCGFNRVWRRAPAPDCVAVAIKLRWVTTVPGAAHHVGFQNRGLHRGRRAARLLQRRRHQAAVQCRPGLPLSTSASSGFPTTPLQATDGLSCLLARVRWCYEAASFHQATAAGHYWPPVRVRARWATAWPSRGPSSGVADTRGELGWSVSKRVNPGCSLRAGDSGAGVFFGVPRDQSRLPPAHSGRRSGPVDGGRSSAPPGVLFFFAVEHERRRPSAKWLQ